RLYGYDHIPVTLPSGTMTRGKLTAAQTKRRKVRRFLEGAGLYEAITYSLTSADKAKQYMVEPNEKAPVALALPMSEERSQLRLSLVPQLLEAVSYNVARKNDSVALYEVGSIFLPTEEGELPKEEQHLAGVMTGLALHHAWQGEKKVVDFFVVKGVLEGLFDVLGVSNQITYAPAKREGMHPGRTADIVLEGEVIGFIGQLHPEAEKQLDVKNTFVFELSLVKVFGADAEETYYSAIPRFPSMTRDMAVVVTKETKAGEMKQVIAEAGGELLKDVTLFDLYEGEKMEEGKKSLAFSMNYFDPERTLTDEEVTEAHNRVLTAVEEKFGAELRK
ncbi:phenylalanine--tRNA ligase subunit beta, partial [Bacillus paranthracis]|nr:phenylalanine--tRNA ligase subunit beta [Bacillus paranthracis]